MNLGEAEEIDQDDLEAASEFVDRLKENSKKELCFGHMGNGITIWFKGTNTRIAHINIDRKVKYYEQLTNEQTKEIEDYAKTADPQISTTQEEKVFKDRPMKYFKTKIHPPFAGTDETYALKAIDQKQADEMSYQKAVQVIDDRYEQFGDDDGDVEREYDYSATEITEEQFNEMLEDGYENLTTEFNGT